MFGARLVAFIVAVLLATHVISPTDGWFVALVVLIGLSLLRSFMFWPWTLMRWGARRVRTVDSNWRVRRMGWADGWWS